MPFAIVYSDAYSQINIFNWTGSANTQRRANTQLPLLLNKIIITVHFKIDKADINVSPISWGYFSHCYYLQSLKLSLLITHVAAYICFRIYHHSKNTEISHQHGKHHTIHRNESCWSAADLSLCLKHLLPAIHPSLVFDVLPPVTCLLLLGETHKLISFKIHVYDSFSLLCSCDSLLFHLKCCLLSHFYSELGVEVNEVKWRNWLNQN